MKRKNTYSPFNNLISRQLNLSDFNFEKPVQNCIKRFKNQFKIDLNENKLINFIFYTYNHAEECINKYSHYFSNHLYTQPTLFTILAMKIYLKLTYREISFLIDLSDNLKKFFHIKRAPHYTTLQKFFKRLPARILNKINQLILIENDIKPEMIVLDGSGFTNDNADKYYAQIRKKERKSYIKNHIAIDVKSRLILNYQTQKGPKYDTQFAIASIRKIKKYKPHYILADRAYDTEPIRKCINEEIRAFDQIPLKKRAKKGKYRLNSPTIFRNKIYRKRNNVESVFSVIKRLFDGTNQSKSTKLSIKETKLKNTIYNIHRSIQIN